MKRAIPPSFCRNWSLWALACVGLGAAPCLRAGEADEVVAVYSSISPEYKRTVLADGSHLPELYAFGEGGNLGGAVSDATIDRLNFMDVARLIAPALEKEAYLPSDPRQPEHTRLLIMIYWGTTIGTDGTANSAQYQLAQSLNPPPRAGMSPPPTGGGAAAASDPSNSGRSSEAAINAAIKSADDSAQQQSLMLTTMANRQRDKQNVDNAVVLGFLDEMKKMAQSNSPALARQRQDVIDQVEESRYYVVLMAYDFQMVWHQRQRKLLWETRFSIPTRRNAFNEQLAAMAQSAAKYFGEDSGGIARKHLREGRVDLGELKILGDVPEKK